MLTVLTHNILPVFAVLALGFFLGRTGKMATDDARAANRIAFLIFQPTLIFPLVAAIDLSALDPGAILTYAAAEIATFGVAYCVARYVFRRAHLEAWLLGMAIVFVNALLYIWPISVLIYGEGEVLPITAIVAFDASLSFAFFIISMEVMAGDSTQGGAIRRISQNPVLIAIVLGSLVNLARIEVPVPILTAFEFTGAAAAPLTLFALGVILSQSPLVPTPVVAAMTALKVAAFPVIVWAAFVIFPPDPTWAAQLTLTAAGPSGAMAFALALLYKVRTDAIAPVIIWTSILSLFSLAMLA